MAYMKRNVNFGLILLIVATLLLFAGFTVYYQITYAGLSEEYQTKINELDALTASLLAEKTKLNETSYQLKIKAEREEDLSSKYDDMKSIKEQLERDKALLQEELSDTKSDLAQKSAELTATKNDLSIANSKIDDLEDTIDSKNNEIDRLNTKVSCLETTADDSEGNC